MGQKTPEKVPEKPFFNNKKGLQTNIGGPKQLRN
jgi:hypothetical protein